MMTGLAGLKEGDPLVVSAATGTEQRTVAAVGRVWLTDSKGRKFRIDDGKAEGTQTGRSSYAMTLAEYEERCRYSAEVDLLTRWGLSPAANPKRKMTGDQRARMLDLLASFEAADGLPPELADHAFGRIGCQVIEGEPVMAARARGGAAECAADASIAFRRGDISTGRDLLRSVARNLTAWTWERLP